MFESDLCRGSDVSEGHRRRRVWTWRRRRLWQFVRAVRTTSVRCRRRSRLLGFHVRERGEQTRNEKRELEMPSSDHEVHSKISNWVSRLGFVNQLVVALFKKCSCRIWKLHHVAYIR